MQRLQTSLHKGFQADGGVAMAASSSATPSFDNERPLKTYPVSSRLLALRLLQTCRCSACRQPLREPVTLPCGHSACLQCLIDHTQTSAKPNTRGGDTTELANASSLPSTSHLPPRFPLAVTTIPCPKDGCARSAIGRGIGSWKGFNAQYGDSIHADAFKDIPMVADDLTDSAPVVLDGFVIPTNTSSNELGVMPAQPRASFDVKYAISRYALLPVDIMPDRSLLRCDVTLSKAVDVLRRLAGVPANWPMSEAVKNQATHSPQYAGHASRFMRNTQASRLRRRQPQHTHSHYADGRHAPGSRTEIDTRFLGVMGASEDGVDSGAMGGGPAVLAEASDEEDVFLAAPENDDDQHYGNQYDEDDEEIGGAFARTTDEKVSPALGSTRRLSANEYALNGKSSKVDAVDLAREVEESLVAEAQWDQEVPEVRAKAIDLLHSEMLDVLECQLCYMPLFQPLTTPCGHTFCRRCFARSLDHSTACPLCRDEMPPFSFFQEHPSNETILSLMNAKIRPNDNADVASNMWGLADMYKERQTAIEREERESLLSTPIFVCTLGFPKMPTILHIFEPRYRLMIRRCLESGHPRFGMVLHSQELNSATPGMSTYGTMLEIKTVQMLPDGRSMIETVGSHRFRLFESGSLDGYSVGRIAPIEDVAPEAESELEQASMGIMDTWTTRLSASRSNSDDSGEEMSSDVQMSADGSGSIPSSGSTTSTTSTFKSLLSIEEARDAYHCFQAALGIDSLMRQTGSQPSAVAVSSLIQRSTVELTGICNTFLETLRSGSAPWLITRLNDTYGPLPDASDVAAYGYWMAMVIPIDEHEKAKLLPIRSARLRLCIVVYWIEQLRQTWWFNHGCSVQ